MRRALYVLFARLFAGPPDAKLYARLRAGGLADLAEVQGIDLTSDLPNEEDAEAYAMELGLEYGRIIERVSLRASDYESGARDPVAALGAYLREHRLEIDCEVDLPCDHLALVLGIMGELAGQAEGATDDDAHTRARAFFLRYIQPWCQQALADVAAEGGRQFYRGLAAMVSAFLESERRHYEVAA